MSLLEAIYSAESLLLMLVLNVMLQIRHEPHIASGRIRNGKHATQAALKSQSSIKPAAKASCMGLLIPTCG